MTQDRNELANELLPCPFCGASPELITGGPGNWFVRCVKCKAGTDDTMRDHAAKLWNTRSQLPAEGARMREALVKIRKTAVMPFPDPGAHSWRVFAEAVYREFQQIQRIAYEALASQEKQP